MYVIRNGIIVQPDRLLFGYELVVRGDRIDAIQRQGRARRPRRRASGSSTAHGGYVVPGLVDIHSGLYRDGHLAAPDRPHGLPHGALRGGARAARPWRDHDVPLALGIRATTRWTSSRCASGTTRSGSWRSWPPPRRPRAETPTSSATACTCGLRSTTSASWTPSSATCAPERSTSSPSWTTRPGRGSTATLRSGAAPSGSATLSEREAAELAAEFQATPKLAFEQLRHLAGVGARARDRPREP